MRRIEITGANLAKRAELLQISHEGSGLDQIRERSSHTREGLSQVAVHLLGLGPEIGPADYSASAIEGDLPCDVDGSAVSRHHDVGVAVRLHQAWWIDVARRRALGPGSRQRRSGEQEYAKR
jgi:hypothetical protein